MMIEQLERNAVKWIAKLSPWLAPIPSAYFVAESSIVYLGLPLSIAIIVAVAIETLGLSTMYTRLRLANWNGNKLKSDAIAPTKLANMLVGAYLVITTVLIVVLKVYPPTAIIAPVLFPPLALVGTMNLVLIAQQEQRESQAKADKEDRKEKRAQAKQVIAEPEQTVAIDTCWCGYIYNGNGVKSKAAHVRKHYGEIKEATSNTAAHLILQELYPNATTPDTETVYNLWRSATGQG